ALSAGRQARARRGRLVGPVPRGARGTRAGPRPGVVPAAGRGPRARPRPAGLRPRAHGLLHRRPPGHDGPVRGGGRVPLRRPFRAPPPGPRGPGRAGSRGRQRSALLSGRTRPQMDGLLTPVTAHVMSFAGSLLGLMRTVRERTATDRRPASW